jgi:hypothetical protein
MFFISTNGTPLVDGFAATAGAGSGAGGGATVSLGMVGSFMLI